MTVLIPRAEEAEGGGGAEGGAPVTVASELGGDQGLEVLWLRERTRYRYLSPPTRGEWTQVRVVASRDPHPGMSTQEV